jgi:predicted nucleotidyltransferase
LTLVEVTPVIELAEHPARIIEVIIEWAKVHQDIRGVALVGSHARRTARLDSDIDLVVLAVNTEAFRADGSWIEAIDWSGAGVKVANWGDEDYGAVWSRRIWLSPGAEVEISFAPVAWASIAPLDAGTRQVISDGCRVLHDPAGFLGRLYEAVQSLDPRTADAPPAVLQPVPVFDARGGHMPRGARISAGMVRHTGFDRRLCFGLRWPADVRVFRACG